MEERLQKILARAGVASRRAAEELILAGRVTVNGQVVRELGSRADPDNDAVAVEGVKIVRARQQHYLMLHKPAGYVTTRSDPDGRPTVYELVPDIPGLFTVGRLDMETEGLLLLTTDGEWAEKVAHPRNGVEREYEARTAGPMPPGSLEKLQDGIMLDGRLARPLSAREVGREGFSSILSIVMLEGRRREVRLLCAGAGIRVKRLIRRRFGTVRLGWLAPGHWRHLTQQEVVNLVEGRARHVAARRPTVSRRSGRQAEQRRGRGV